MKVVALTEGYSGSDLTAVSTIVRVIFCFLYAGFNDIFFHLLLIFISYAYQLPFSLIGNKFHFYFSILVIDKNLSSLLLFFISSSLVTFILLSPSFYLILCHLTLPYLTAPYLTVPYPILPQPIYLILTYLSLPYRTLSYSILSYLTISSRTLSYSNLSYLILPYLTLPYLTLSSLNLSYHTLPYHTLPTLGLSGSCDGAYPGTGTSRATESQG